jgi:hypothetical protein
VFRYSLPERMEFRFDAAGIDRNGGLVVIEEESGPISSLHVHGHLGRLLLMSALGEPTTSAVWVSDEQSLPRLRQVIRGWNAVLEDRLGLRPLRQTYVTRLGKVVLEE